MSRFKGLIDGTLKRRRDDERDEETDEPEKRKRRLGGLFDPDRLKLVVEKRRWLAYIVFAILGILALLKFF